MKPRFTTVEESKYLAFFSYVVYRRMGLEILVDYTVISATEDYKSDRLFMHSFLVSYWGSVEEVLAWQVQRPEFGRWYHPHPQKNPLVSYYAM